MTIEEKMILEDLKKTFPREIAEMLVSVQPMDTPEIKAAFKYILENGKSEEELRAEGYVPACDSTRLMWIKKE